MSSRMRLYQASTDTSTAVPMSAVTLQCAGFGAASANAVHSKIAALQVGAIH